MPLGTSLPFDDFFPTLAFWMELGAFAVDTAGLLQYMVG